MLKITDDNGSVVFDVRVVPRASRSAVVGEMDGALKIRVAAAPVDGAANAELIGLLAKLCSVSKSNVQIIGGETSKTKRVRVFGATAAQVRRLF